MFFSRKPPARATLYCTCAKPSAKSKAFGLRGYSYRKNGTVSSREKKGVGEGPESWSVTKETALGFVATPSAAWRRLSSNNSDEVLNPQ